MVKMSSQTVLALLTYQYLHKSRKNPLCPRGESIGLIMRDFDLIRIWFTECMYEDQEQWKAQNKTIKFSCIFSLNYNKTKPSLIFFWRPKRGTLISHLTMKNEIPFLSVFEIAYGVQVKMWVTSWDSIMKNSIYNLQNFKSLFDTEE